MAVGDVVRAPEVFIQLDKDALTQVKAAELRPGSKVRLIVYGVVHAFDQRVGDPEGLAGDSGSLSIQMSNMKVAGNNDIAELFEEEFDG